MKLTLSLLAVAAGVACSDATKPTMESIAGTYTLLDVAHTDQSGTTHYGPPDSHINLVLAVDGTVTGDMLVKRAAASGGDFIADMSGTWRIDGSNVRFDQTADTFMRDIPFVFLLGKRLGGFIQNQNGTTSVTLAKQ